MTEETIHNTATANLGHDLLVALVDILKNQQKPWHTLAEPEKNKIMDHLRDDIDVCIKKTMATLLTGKFPAVKGKLHQVNIQDGIKANIHIDGDSAQRHALVDAASTQVLIVMGNADDYLKTMGQVKAESDQGDLFAGAAKKTTAADLPPVVKSTEAIDPDKDEEQLDETDTITRTGEPRDDDEGEEPEMPEDVPRGTQNDETAEISPAENPVYSGTDDATGIENEDTPESSPPADDPDFTVQAAFLQGLLGKVGYTVPIEAVHNWNDELRVQAATYANDKFEAGQLGEKLPETPFFLTPYK